MRSIDHDRVGGTGTPDGPELAGSGQSRARAVVEVVAKALTDHPEYVRVTESTQGGTTLIELFMAPGELGRVIGRQGRTAAALRTLAATAAELEGRTVAVEFRESR